MPYEPHVDDPVEYQGAPGHITAVDLRRQTFWAWFSPLNAELFFSLRQDGNFRLFPGPAGGPPCRVDY